uniref:hypothetical protein n=1 Tax=uncultured Tenacibaculum sp. TaxID=174713 RepID=UPI00260CBEEC|nr:hypothetical protein [uncultured Tenacibaculum sp.]
MQMKKEEFVYRANPNEWLEVSDELNESIKVITKHSKSEFLKSDTWDGIPIRKLMSSRSLFLLMGFALENLIKGILIFDNPELVNNGELNKKVKSHNIKNLVSEISDLELDDQSNELLEILSDAIPDWGRYPCPLKFQQLKDEVKFTEEMSTRYTALREQMRNKLIERLKKGWISGLENKITNVRIISIEEKN